MLESWPLGFPVVTPWPELVLRRVCKASKDTRDVDNLLVFCVRPTDVAASMLSVEIGMTDRPDEIEVLLKSAVVSCNIEELSPAGVEWICLDIELPSPEEFNIIVPFTAVLLGNLEVLYR